MKKMIFTGTAFAISAMILLSSCSKTDPAPIVTLYQKTDSVKVNFSSTTPFTLFSFKNDAVVANSDSATNKWDFGLRFTTFIVNSGISGPANAGAILQDNIYGSVTAAPVTGYGYDTATNKRAIKDGSWYDYNPVTHAFSPKAGKTFIFRTAENYYVKMELLAVDYEPFAGPTPTRLIYRFRYTYQASGAKTF
ncbi:MAG: HmuY family protein [Chitinophagaceae bacterium]|nr:HmuY family protein [Chitinophagaceae bacterium]MBL0054759.1 HmuY family protein [Chitinophagaceae bacterium]